MTFDVSDLRSTIIPKSDQLNAEQLLTGPITVTVSDVERVASNEQPVIVHYYGENGRPYKPGLTMRKVLILAWGEDGKQWIGRSMTLFCDPSVRFGGAEVGGIRISHLSDIPRDIQVSLTATRGKKAAHIIRRLDPAECIRTAPTIDALANAFRAAYKAARTDQQRAELTAAKDARKAELQPPQDQEPTE